MEITLSNNLIHSIYDLSFRYEAIVLRSILVAFAISTLEVHWFNALYHILTLQNLFLDNLIFILNKSVLVLGKLTQLKSKSY